jgi:hypothetical protein
MGLFKYVVLSAWRESGLMARLLWAVGVAIPAGLSTLAERTDIPFLATLASLLSWLEWLAVALFMAVIGLLRGISIRAYRLDQSLAPKLACDRIHIWNSSGTYFVRVQLRNLSTSDVNGAKPYLDDIEADDPIRQLDQIDFSLPLYTQERLRERLFAPTPVNHQVRPVNFSPGQRKWLELFQITEEIDRQLNLIVINGRKDLIPMDRMEFRCSVYSAARPIKLSALYEEDMDGWQISLLNEEGNVIDTARPSPGEVGV